MRARWSGYRVAAELEKRTSGDVPVRLETPAEIVDKLVAGEDAHKYLDGLRALVAEIEARLGDRAQLVGSNCGSK
jgi:hypothetical protein